MSEFGCKGLLLLNDSAVVRHRTKGVVLWQLYGAAGKHGLRAALHELLPGQRLHLLQQLLAYFDVYGCGLALGTYA